MLIPTIFTTIGLIGYLVTFWRMCVRHLQLDNLSPHQRAEVGIYKRKSLREKVNKKKRNNTCPLPRKRVRNHNRDHAFLPRKARFKKKAYETHDRDQAIDQEKASFRILFFFFHKLPPPISTSPHEWKRCQYQGCRFRSRGRVREIKRGKSEREAEIEIDR